MEEYEQETRKRPPRKQVRKKKKNKKNKKSTLSLIALILGIIALIVEIGGASGAASQAQDEASQIGTAIGLAIVLPSAIALFLAVIFNAIGYFTRGRGFTLTSGILYAVALVLFPLWGFVGIPSMILQFIAFAKLKKPYPTD